MCIRYEYWMIRAWAHVKPIICIERGDYLGTSNILIGRFQQSNSKTPTQNQLKPIKILNLAKAQTEVDNHFRARSIHGRSLAETMAIKTIGISLGCMSPWNNWYYYYFHHLLSQHIGDTVNRNPKNKCPSIGLWRVRAFVSAVCVISIQNAIQWFHFLPI